MADVRKMTDTEGLTSRHPDSDLADYVNRGYGALYRILAAAIPSHRFLASVTDSLTPYVSTVALPADFRSLLSVDIDANGSRQWLLAYEFHERPFLADQNSSSYGTPNCYRLQAGNIEFLPSPDSAYSYTLWYVPNATQLTSDAATADVIDRLDEYVINFAARIVAKKDKNWDLADRCAAELGEMRSDIEVLGRSRDMNSPPRVVDVTLADRFGRSYRRGR